MSDRPVATVRRNRLSWVWLIPLVAAIVAAFLAWRTLSQQGPQISITFKSGDGITPGQTRVRYKAVELGQVENVKLSDNAQDVVVTVRMRGGAERFLTDQARFWVVRPRLSSGSLAGIETIVSGSYIEMDPGAQSDKEQYAFQGLDSPPAVRSGEPGTTYKLRAERLGSIASGAPVFYRDIAVGEVLDYNMGDGLGPVVLTIFVRSPYDKLVRTGTAFWNASGFSVEIGSSGIHVELASLPAVLNGGVAFSAPKDPEAKPVAANTEFKLFPNLQDARTAGFTDRQDFVTYFESSVRGLSAGAPVEFFGIQIGNVTGVEFQLDENTGRARVKVRFQIQPERIKSREELRRDDPINIARKLVANGLRAQLRTSSFITGSMLLALDFDRSAERAELTQEGGDWIIPSEGGGLDNIMAAAGNLANKLDRLPLEEIGANLNRTLRSAAVAMNSVNELASRANTGLSPVFARLPTITNGLEQAVTRADRVLTSFDRSYGKDSDIQRELARAMVQVGDTARSIRQLADFLDRHPEALVRGRAGYAPQ